MRQEAWENERSETKSDVPLSSACMELLGRKQECDGLHPVSSPADVTRAICLFVSLGSLILQQLDARDQNKLEQTRGERATRPRSRGIAQTQRVWAQG